MSTNKLVKQFRRELTKNPKKAAILGLLVLVASYFWAPLVWGWLGAGATSADQPAATAGVAAAPAPAPVPSATLAPPAAGSAASPQPPHPWRQLVRWMENDPRAAAATWAAAWRDPFVSATAPDAALAARQEQTSKAETALEEVTPGSLGLALGSTIVGPRRRLARIDGKTYEEGSPVEVAKDGQQYVFVVEKIEPRRVVLGRNQQLFELAIPEPAVRGYIEPVSPP